MKKFRNIEYWTQVFCCSAFGLILSLIGPSHAMAQQEIALPTDGAYSSEHAPQGGLRYHRQLYLITAEEMTKAGFTSGTDLNSIGFTLAAAQDTSTIAAFDVYLENTTDEESRTDTNWTTVPVMSNSTTLEYIPAGNYEWQVQAVCSSNSNFSDALLFSTLELDGCNQPINLTESNVTSSSATLEWYAPESPSFTHFAVEYRATDMVVWNSTTTAVTSLMISSLSPSKNYQWRVRTICGIDSSEVSGGSFVTLNVNNCNPATNLTSSNPMNSSVVLNWTAATGADRYDIRFRRLGTSFWLTTLSFTNTFNLNVGLIPGTTYEWEVRTVCPAGQGHFTSSPTTFQTMGTGVCYPPTNLFIDEVSDTTVSLNWTASEGALSYLIRYRLKNSISWLNAITPMTQVHQDTIFVPESAGDLIIPFAGGSPFTYTGGGLYVAFQYANDTIQLSSFNNAMATEKNSGIVNQSGADSAQLVLCLNATSNSLLPEYLITSRIRPKTTFGSPSFVDSVGIVAVYALGHYALNYADTAPVYALVANYANEARDYCVAFTVVDMLTGTQRYMDTKCVTIEADTAIEVSFNEWVPQELGTDSLIITIQAASTENVLSNNKAAYIQTVGNLKIGYDDNSKRATNAGFGDSSGLILARYEIMGCGQINSAEIFLDFTAADHDLYAVILDANGLFLDSSAVFTPTEDEAGNYHTFYFPSTPYIGAGEFYVGLAQQADPLNPYYPVGVQYESTTVRQGAYYRDSIGGMHLMDMPSPGRLMIRADIGPGSDVPVIEGDLSLCLGDMNALTVASATQRFATEVINFSSQVSNQSFSSNQVLGAPNVYPNYEVNGLAWVSATPDGQREYIELRYSIAAPINYVDIYETFNPGAVDTVYAKNPGTNLYEVVYSGPATILPGIARINRIDFPLTAFSVSEIRIALASNSIPGFHSIDAVAIGERTSPGNFTSYLWSPNGETTNGISVASPGEYSVVVTDANGCENETSVTVISPNTVVPIISVAVGDQTTFCQGDSVTLISDQISGNIWSTGATTQSITVNIAGSYSVEYDDGTGCGLSQSASIMVTVNPLPTPNISGNLGICPGGSTTLDAGVYASYLWSNGAITQTISVNLADVFDVVVTDINGCSAQASVITTILTPPSPSIAGSPFLCPGGSTILDAGAGYSTYLWSGGETTQTIVVTTAATFNVQVTDANGCDGSASISTGLYTPPSPSISGNLDFCLGESTQLNAGNYSAYLWSTGETTAQIVAAAAGPYDVTVTDGNGCQGSIGVNVSINIPPTPVITGSFSFCGGSSTTLDAGAGFNTYLWSTGAISQQITVLDTATYSVTVTDANNCVGVASATTTIEGSIPVPPGPISGDTDGLCNATNVFYSIDPVPNASFYVWTVPDSVDILSGQGTTQIIVNVGNGFAGGDIVVAASNACGQSPSIDPTFLTINTSATFADTIMGPTSGPCNIGLVQYTINPVPGATSYQWTVPPGATIVSGQGTSMIDMTFSGSGDVCVEVVNSCGTSPTTCLEVALNDVVADAGGCQLVVLNVSPFDCVEFTASVGGGGTAPYDYTWTDANGMIVGNNQTLNACPLQSTFFTVTVVDANGCTTSDDAEVIVIQANCGNNKVSVCHKANNRTRCLNANAALSHLAHGDRLGSCGVPDPCDPSLSGTNVIHEVANMLNFISMNRIADEADITNAWTLFPNPTNGLVALNFLATPDEKILIEVIDQLGRVVKSIHEIGRGEMEFIIDVYDIPSGMYYVKLQQDKTSSTKRLIVQ